MEWRSELSPEQYHILREKGTEIPFTGVLNSCKDEGVYLCAGCGATLFLSDTKYDSGSGWPSFFAPYDKGAITEIDDMSHGMVRVEVVCSHCGGHLGHVFNDGPEPTGLRYCVNSISMSFQKAE